MGYKVVAPLVIVGDGAGRMYHFYKDAVLPDEGLDSEHVKSLLTDKMIEKLDAPKAADDSTYDPASGAPAKSAKKGDWEAFAHAQGATDADLDGKSKDDLIAAYGG